MDTTTTNESGELQCTPGEWRVKAYGNAFAVKSKGNIEGVPDNGAIICKTIYAKDEEANAHMLAASKDMYLELSEILKWGKTKNGKFEFTTSIEKFKELQALLQKANANYKP
jgi:hypothetical protein